LELDWMTMRIALLMDGGAGTAALDAEMKAGEAERKAQRKRLKVVKRRCFPSFLGPMPGCLGRSDWSIPASVPAFSDAPASARRQAYPGSYSRRRVFRKQLYANNCGRICFQRTRSRVPETDSDP